MNIWLILFCVKIRGMFSHNELRKYYLYNLVISIFDMGSGNFTMVYFYFHGFSVMAILGAILTYGLTCLVILKPVGILLEKIGPQRTFRLHIISEVLKYLSFLCIFIVPSHALAFFLLVQFFNAFNVMLSRIPLTAYFSAYGDNAKRGQQIGLTNNIQLVCGVLVPIVVGALIQQTGIIIITSVIFIAHVIAAFILTFDEHVKIKNPIQIKNLIALVPAAFTKSFFISKLAYPFSADLLAIYIAITLQSFAVLGIFIGLRTGIAVVLNYAVGRMTDTKNIRSIYFFAVIVSSLFWLVLPSIHEATAIFILQFTLGLAGLVTSIPFEGVYHNTAKESGAPLQFAIWREITIQAGLVVGTSITMLLLWTGLVKNWQTLLPFGALSALAMLFILPYFSKRTSSVL